jgi:DNA-directed RNA polymerase I, II, and III subunit RPABC1
MRVLKTCREMLLARGYQITNNHQKMLVGAKEGGGIVLFITNIDKFSVVYIKPLIETTRAMGLDKCIIVYKNSLTSCAKKTCEANSLGIEFFSSKELKVNISHHDYVPQHTKVEEPEKSIIKAKYISNLPTLLRTEAIARFYQFVKGDLVKIERKGGSIAYRVVY